METLIQWHDRLLAIPWVREWLDVLVFLFGVSGAFWILSKAAGRLAAGIHAVLDRSLAELFAVVYNLALAVLFASVLVYSIYAERGGRANFLAYEAAGFVLVYLVLGSTYAEKSGKISEYALPGYWGAQAAYLVFCVRSQYLRNPVTPRAYAWTAWAMRGWVAKLAALFTVAVLVLRGLQAAGRGLAAVMPKRRTA